MHNDNITRIFIIIFVLFYMYNIMYIMYILSNKNLSGTLSMLVFLLCAYT